MPKRKVAAGGLAGAVSVVVIWMINSLGVDIPGEVASAFTTILSFVTSYMTEER